MLHNKRIWSVIPAESAEWLAEQLTQLTYCGCCGFRLGQYVFVNDATCADGTQEYAVLKPAGDKYVQIESLTFSWMTRAKAIDLIRRILEGNFDDELYDTIDVSRLQTPEEHGRCYLCD
jgi:hypothetical protein